jgi:hypothetical protein
MYEDLSLRVDRCMQSSAPASPHSTPTGALTRLQEQPPRKGGEPWALVTRMPPRPGGDTPRGGWFEAALRR